MYKTRGESRGVSSNKFFMINIVPYKTFNDRFPKPQKKVVPVMIERSPVQPTPR